MKLRPDPFRMIFSGEKTIEFRLHDEKRSLINKGDYIRFTDMAAKERTVLVEVVDIFTAPSFVALEQRLIEVGLLSRGAFSPTVMREYYSAEDEENMVLWVLLSELSLRFLRRCKRLICSRVLRG